MNGKDELTHSCVRVYIYIVIETETGKKTATFTFFDEVSKAQDFVFRFVCWSEPSNSSIIYHHVRDKAMLCNLLKIARITTILLNIYQYRWVILCESCEQKKKTRKKQKQK